MGDKRQRAARRERAAAAKLPAVRTPHVMRQARMRGAGIVLQPPVWYIANRQQTAAVYTENDSNGSAIDQWSEKQGLLPRELHWLMISAGCQHSSCSCCLKYSARCCSGMVQGHCAPSWIKRTATLFPTCMVTPGSALAVLSQSCCA